MQLRDVLAAKHLCTLRLFRPEPDGTDDASSSQPLPEGPDCAKQIRVDYFGGLMKIEGCFCITVF